MYENNRIFLSHTYKKLAPPLKKRIANVIIFHELIFGIYSY